MKTEIEKGEPARTTWPRSWRRTSRTPVIPPPWSRWPRPQHRIGEEAFLDLLATYDPRVDEVVEVFGVELRHSRRRALRFLLTGELGEIRHELERAFVGFEGLPSSLELPLTDPFLDDTVGANGGYDLSSPTAGRLSEVLGIPVRFPDLRKPSTATPLELALEEVLRDFLPTRPPESTEDRNGALNAWATERGWDVVDEYGRIGREVIA